MNILIVDDEELMRLDLRDALLRIRKKDEYFFADCFNSAVEVLKNNAIDLAFVDIQLPGENGIELCRKIKEINPKINIVILTAYTEYALDALKLFVSGYILKPVMDDDLKAVLNNLRNPVALEEQSPKLEARCFGNFDVFFGGDVVFFKRKKSKELFAYLVALRGRTATGAEICEAIFENDGYTPQKHTYFRTLVFSLKQDLKKLGVEDVLVSHNNEYAVNIDLLSCDYYDFLLGKNQSKYLGQFMSQYSWSEPYIWGLNSSFSKMNK